MKSEDRYDSLIRYYAERTGLDWLKVKAVMRDAASLTEGVSEDEIEELCVLFRKRLNEFDQDDRLVLAVCDGVDVRKVISDPSDYDVAEFFNKIPDETKKYIARINQYYVEYQHE